MLLLRRFLLGSLIFLTPVPAFAIAPDRYLPKGTQMAAGVQVRRFVEAAVIKKHLHAGLKDFLSSRTGFGSLAKLLALDPWQDIDRVILAGPATLEPERLLLIVRGRFDPAKIEADIADRIKRQPETLQLVQKDGRRFYRHKDAEAALPIFFALVDKEVLLAAAAQEPLLEALVRKDDKEPEPVSKELQTLLAKIDDKATAWAAVLAVPELKKNLAPTPEYRRIVDSVQNLRGSVVVSDGVQADFLIQTNDARAAVEIRKFMEGVKAILILTAVNQDKKNGAVWGDLLGVLKVANDGEAVTIKGQATAEFIEKSVESNRKAKKE
jgi:hypothetical protein